MLLWTILHNLTTESEKTSGLTECVKKGIPDVKEVATLKHELEDKKCGLYFYCPYFRCS